MPGIIFTENYVELVEQRLDDLLPNSSLEPKLLHEAMRYSCLSPGKRLRPMLCLASAQACGADFRVALDAACAIEMVHCFSLIHDDLPSIDNDDMRRGKPTCHKVYGEAVALLAGDGLIALSFEVLSHAYLNSVTACRLLSTLARAVGSNGLVGGEVLDVLSEGKSPDLVTLQTIHARKTGALIAAACVMGGICANASDSQLKALQIYGEAVGLAFQIIDDILNETSTIEQLGKATGSDKVHRKMTYPALMGVESANKAAMSAKERALNALDSLDGDKYLLEYLANYSVERSH